MKKRLSALLCTVVLCLSMLPVRAIDVGDVYFTSVNNTLCPLTMDTMPAWVNGMLYVPASVFDNTVTGAELGMYCSQSSSNNVVTLYSLRRMLVFDLNRGIAYDHHSGESLHARAVNRNGRIYLPVEPVCDFFDLEDTYSYTKYGYLVRIKNESANLDDSDFVDAASVLMSNYLQALLNQQQQTPENSPSVTPDPEDPPQQAASKAQICLGFRCQTGEGLTRILDHLEQKKIRGIFFLSTQILTDQDDLIRRIVGSGHSIGLLSQEETMDATRQQMTQANQLLRHVARTAATAALVPDGQREALEQEGWVCWRQTVSGLPGESERTSVYTQRITRTIGSRKGTVCLTLDDTARTADVLPALLQQLQSQEYTVITPLETRI